MGQISHKHNTSDTAMLKTQLFSHLKAVLHSSVEKHGKKPRICDGADTSLMFTAEVFH